MNGIKLEYFSSMAHLTHLLELETVQISELSEYINTIEDSLNSLKLKLSKIKKERNSEIENVAQHLRSVCNSDSGDVKPYSDIH